MPEKESFWHRHARRHAQADHKRESVVLRESRVTRHKALQSCSEGRRACLLLQILGWFQNLRAPATFRGWEWCMNSVQH